jgi:site-specific DNA-methyltransferase (adenine-specific)
MLADPTLGDEFAAKCHYMGLPGSELDWKRALLAVRKAGNLKSRVTRRPKITWESLDACTFASEIAWKKLRDDFNGVSLDDILCDPSKTREFDRIARRFAPGHSSFDYRWAALMIRKRAREVRDDAGLLPPALARKRLPHCRDLNDIDFEVLIKVPGVYVLRDIADDHPLYVGETLSIGNRLDIHWKTAAEFPRLARFGYLEMQGSPHLRDGKQAQLIKRCQPLLNLPDLAAVG